MSDIVERLEQRSLALRGVVKQTVVVKHDADLNDEAAAEIESLRARLAEKDKALDLLIENNRKGVTGAKAREAWMAARRAREAWGGEDG